MNKSHLLCLLLTLLGWELHSQDLKPVPQYIQHLKIINAPFDKVAVFNGPVQSIDGNINLEREIDKGQLLSLDHEAIDQILDKGSNRTTF